MTTLFHLIFSFLFCLAAVRLFQLWLSYWGRRAVRQGSGAFPIRAAALAIAVPGFAFGLFTDKPIFGLAGLLALPALVHLITALRGTHHRAALDDSGLSYLHALRGLVHSGLGLSAAFFRLAEVQRTPFAIAMAKSLDGYADGKTLAACLDRLHRRVDSPLMGATLRALQSAYHRGLPVGVVLDQMVPALEAERDADRRVADLRHAAWAQAAVAFVVPWILVAASLACRPEAGWLSGASGWVLVAGALAVEGTGVWLIGQCSRFC
jgi:hypothetical protein